MLQITKYWGKMASRHMQKGFLSYSNTRDDLKRSKQKRNKYELTINLSLLGNLKLARSTKFRKSSAPKVSLEN